MYKGLHLNLLQIPVSYVYLTTLEVSKEKLINKAKQTSLPENLIVPSCYMLSGFIASTLSQIIVTPLDVVTQYKQTINASNMNKDANIQGKTTMQITRDLYKSDGFIKGFYRGFTVATLFFGLHSGAIWAVYYQMLESVGSIKFLRQILDGDKHKHEFGLRVGGGFCLAESADPGLKMSLSYKIWPHNTLFYPNIKSRKSPLPERYLP